MLRFLRITGIVLFAVLVGFGANNLWKMYQSGDLADEYNSARKANITLTSFSALALVVLGYFEIAGLRRFSEPRGYGGDAEHDDAEKAGSRDTSSIYSTPTKVDEWKGHRSHSSHSHRHRRLEGANIWMGLLRIFCIVFPLIYSGLLVLYLMKPPEAQEIRWLLPAVYGALVVFSLVTSIGLLAKKKWGLILGYVLSISNLVIFPFGTALGLILLITLVGASAVFLVADREKRRAARRKTSRSMQALV